MTSSVFLGTGAAELYPNPFCGCPTCKRARENGETRLRAAFLLDEKTMIDFGPDVCAASQHYHAPLDRVENVLITHTHEDHFAAPTLGVLTMTDMDHTMNFHLSEEGKAWLDRTIEKAGDLPGTIGNTALILMKQNRIAFHTMRPYETYEIGGKQVTPLKTNHYGNSREERALNYLIRWERGTWLYACDTGLYSKENLDFLRSYCNGALDVIIHEGTFGSLPGVGGSGHMDVASLGTQFRNLRTCQALDDHTRVYLTHINQVQHYSHAEYQSYVDQHMSAHVVVAHDGLRI
ncbi:MAG: MBL fold metallo-hydrolase [Clostridia bacterium]|nr:MBL fold metallo-hydrolase [Clostridia bacterium]